MNESARSIAAGFPLMVAVLAINCLPQGGAASGAEPQRLLNLSTVTGTYVREPSGAKNGKLKAEALPFDKVRFEISASGGESTGEASGLLEMVNHRIVLPHDEGKLLLEFKGDTVNVSGQDSPFCGAGATLLGDYKKMDDKKPKFSPDE